MITQAVPNPELIEALLGSIQPTPSDRYYHRMASAPWAQTSTAIQEKPWLKPRLRIVIAATLVLLLASIVWLATPQGRAWAQSTLRFFTRTESNTFPNPYPTAEIVLIEVTPGVPFTPEPTPTSNIRTLIPFYDKCGGWYNPTCTVEQIRSMVNFEVKELARIPAGIRLIGATGGPEEVVINYSSDDMSGGINLSQRPWTDDLAKTRKVALTATVETVPIGNVTGEYVKGLWSMSASDPVATWDPSDDIQTLRWREGDMFYTMMATSSIVDKDDMAALAAGLTTQPVVTQPVVAVQDTKHLKTVQEAEALAGFNVIEPTQLPDGYTFKYASYVTETGSVCLYFMHSSDQDLPSLRIVESVMYPSPTLRDIFNPDPDLLKLGVTVITDSLSIGGATEGQSLYISGAIDEDPYCDDTSESQALVVQMADSWFIIFARQDWGFHEGFLTKLEMVKLAENITGVHTIPEDQLDPERLPSVEAAEQLAGLDIKTPTRLPAGTVFGYASYVQNGPVKGITLNYTNFSISARFGVTETLEMMDNESPGFYKKLSVSGQPALYVQGCGTDQGWDWDCSGGLSLIWFDDGVRYSIGAIGGDLNEETAVAIAESIR